MNVLRWLALSAAAFAPLTAWAEGDGLSTDADRVPWARFQGRLSYAATTPLVGNGGTSVDGTGLQVSGLSLMGDVYFGAASGRDKTAAGGFRATSGVIVGTRSMLWSTPAVAPAGGLLNVDRRLFGPSASGLGYSNDPNNDGGTVPYVGIGYSSPAARSGWSFSADLGLVSLSPGNVVRLGRVFGGGQSLDEVVRDMRLTPVLQLGASYSF